MERIAEPASTGMSQPNGKVSPGKMLILTWMDAAGESQWLPPRILLGQEREKVVL